MINGKISRLMISGVLAFTVATALTGLAAAQTKESSEGVTQTCQCSESGHAGQPSDVGAKSIRQGVDPEILAVLDKLEKLGQTIKNLQADLSLEKVETWVDDRTVKIGQLYYQREKDALRFRVSFEQVKLDRRTIKQAEHFVFADGWLTHRQERSKREDRYQITRPDQPTTELMKIGKSPLPLPIGQKTEDVLKNFEVSLIKPDKENDPAGVETVHLKLIPRKGTELAQSHRVLEFWLGREDCLPIRSRWENDSGDLFTVQMSKLRINKRIKDSTFKLSGPPSGYDVEIHPLPKESKEQQGSGEIPGK